MGVRHRALGKAELQDDSLFWDVLLEKNAENFLDQA